MKKLARRGGRVLVAMSGGVDSSIVAALLKNRGYDVVGVFMRMHKNSNAKDAKIVAQKLKIPFYVLDVQKEFKKKVVDYFIDEYKKGNTPNPCVMCNKHIKFKFLIDKAMELGADYVATGHYAKIKSSKLLVAKDKQKDQSYFLWKLDQKQLNKVLFPLSDYTKERVRELAKKFKLPVYKKPDSQEICFINDLNNFLRQNIKTKTGDIITVDGKKMGEHKGLIFYTIGQRKGIEIGGIGPFYVVKKDFKKNILIVSKNEKDLMQKELIIKDVNWLSGKQYNGKCKVKIRSTTKAQDATIKGNKIIFKKSQRAITSGQSAVFYLGSELIGGGIID
ncbi:MAG: tRNA 2-thiouridine(34) synthase MnmA [Patescibacteria group bacterium]